MTRHDDEHPTREQHRRDVITSYAAAPTRTISVGDVDFAYRELGPTTGVPVIFLTHLAAVLDNWDPRVVDGIAAQHRVIAFDNRGVGASSGSTPEHHRGDGAATRSPSSGRSGFEQVDLLGFSMGGMIAQVIAADAPAARPQAHPRRHRPRRRRGHHEGDPALAPRHRCAGCSPCRTRSSSSSSPGPRTGVEPARSSWPASKERTERPRQAHLAAVLRRPAQGHPPLGPAAARRPVGHPPAGPRRQRRDRPDGAHAATPSIWRGACPNADLVIYPDAGHGGIFQFHEQFVERALAFLGGSPS